MKRCRAGWLVAVLVAAASGQVDLPPLVAAARTDLCQRLGVALSAVTVALLEERLWPNTALGLPREGQAYAQVVTPGHRVVFLAAGRPYLYHTGDKRFIEAPKPVGCEPLDVIQNRHAWAGRLVSLEGSMFRDGPVTRIAAGAVRSGERWVSTSAVAVTGDVLAAFEARLAALEPVAARLYALLDLDPSDPDRPLLRAVTAQRVAPPAAPATSASVSALLAQRDLWHGIATELRGDLVREGDQVWLTDGAARLWLDGPGRADWPVGPARVEGLFERAHEDQTGWGADGAVRERVVVATLEPQSVPPRVERGPSTAAAPTRAALLRFGTACVALRDAADWLGGRLTVKPTDGRVDLELPAGEYTRTVLTVRPGRRIALVAAPDASEPAWPLCLPCAPFVVAGRLYVPVELLEAAFAPRLRVIDGGTTLRLALDDRELQVPLAPGVPPHVPR